MQWILKQEFNMSKEKKKDLGCYKVVQIKFHSYEILLTKYLLYLPENFWQVTSLLFVLSVFM